MKYVTEIAEFAVLLWAEGNSFPKISEQIHHRYEQRVSPATIRSWKENEHPYNWDDWKNKYRAQVAAKQIEDISTETLKARKQVYSGMNTLVGIGLLELQKYLSGDSELKPKSLEGLMRETREILKLYHELFGDASGVIQRISENITDEQMAELQAYLAMKDDDNESV